jgi:hypothetical protein
MISGWHEAYLGDSELSSAGVSPHLSSGESVREKDAWIVIKERPTPEVPTREEAVEVPKQLGPLSRTLLPVATAPKLL